MNEQKRNRSIPLTLSQKGILLLSIPLLLQISLVAGLIHLYSRAESEAARAARDSDISALSNKLMVSDYGLIVQIIESLETNSGIELDSIHSDIQLVEENASRLRPLLKDDPEDIERLDRSLSGIKHMAGMAFSVAKDPENAYKPHGEIRKAIFRALRNDTHDIKEIVALTERRKRMLIAKPDEQQAVREQLKALLISGFLLNGITLGLITLFFRRSILGRLDVMLDNTLRLAMQRPLNDPMKGVDELAKLDCAFHEMSDALKKATAEQREIIENARDVICTLTQNDAFATVSSASISVFGYTPDEMLGQRLVNFVPIDDAAVVRDNLNALKKGVGEQTFNCVFARKDEKNIDLTWSVKWSEEAKTMFCVAHDVTERVQAERLRQEVVQMVSHDLRSPLSSIQIAIEMLQHRISQGNYDLQELFDVAERNVVRMTNLTNDLLDMERLEAGMLELNKSQVSISTAFSQACDLVRVSSDKKQIKLAIVPTNVVAFADADRLNQVLVNLLSNAIKFTGNGKTITLCARESSAGIEISVTDEGRGIPDSVIHTIFDRFKQTRSTDSKDSRGAGLGLAICKALVELHSGKIGVQSSVGRGSVFTFTIPAARMPG
jgi:PAS domain S-box-containing protein